MRAQAEAAEALGLNKEPERKPRREPAEARREVPKAQPRLKVVWNVCDMGGRTVATFDYSQKADAEAYLANLKARGKDPHFLRSEKVPMP
jgi:hypothetical protein